MSTTTLPGLVYRHDLDALVVRLHDGDEPQVPLTAEGVVLNDSHVQVDVHFGTDRRLYLVVIREAANRVPSPVLRSAEGVRLTLVPAVDEPGTFVVPFFPEVALAGHVRLRVNVLGADRHFDLLVAKSGRVVGLVVPDADATLPLPGDPAGEAPPSS